MTSLYQVGSEMVRDGEGEAKQPVHKRSVHPVPKISPKTFLVLFETASLLN